MELPFEIPETIPLGAIDDTQRVREDYGDLKGLMYSIKEFGLIQPLVVTWDENRWLLLAGGRRYKALQALGRTELKHGKEILVREELYNSEDVKVQSIRLSIELEENLKRKDMTWQEQVEGKRKLLELMQSIYGTRGKGAPTESEKAGANAPQQVGFSVRKLAEQLGESPATLSQDINLAKVVEQFPALAKMETKTAAFNRVKDVIAKAKAQVDGVPVEVPKISYRVMVWVDGEKAQADLIALLETMGYKCEPVVI